MESVGYSFNHQLWEYFWKVNKIEDEFTEDKSIRLLSTRDCYQLFDNFYTLSKFPENNNLPLHEIWLDLGKVIDAGRVDLPVLEFICRSMIRLQANLNLTPLIMNVKGFKKLEGESRKFTKWFIRFFCTLEAMELSRERNKGIVPQNFKVFNSRYNSQDFDLTNIKLYDEVIVNYK